MGARAFVAIIGLALVVLLVAQGMQATLNEAGPQIDISDESFTPDPGNVTELDHSNLNNTDYDQTVTVRDNNGDLVDPNTDYVWFENNGTILTVEGGALDGAPSATISYGYEQSREVHRELAGVPAFLFGALGSILPLLAVVMVLAMAVAMLRG